MLPACNVEARVFSDARSCPDRHQDDPALHNRLYHHHRHRVIPLHGRVLLDYLRVHHHRESCWNGYCDGQVSRRDLQENTMIQRENIGLFFNFSHKPNQSIPGVKSLILKVTFIYVHNLVGDCKHFLAFNLLYLLVVLGLRQAQTAGPTSWIPEPTWNWKKKVSKLPTWTQLTHGLRNSECSEISFEF